MDHAMAWSKTHYGDKVKGHGISQRLSAAEALCHLRDPASVRALVKSLDDPEGLVRHHAARGLLALHGLSDNSKDPQHMMYRVMSNDAERHEVGKRDILAAIAGRPISAQ